MYEQPYLFEPSEAAGFSPPRTESPADIVSELCGYAEFGAATRTEKVEGVPYFINEFWTARQRQAHRIHEISYRACFKPQLPAFFIERLTQHGDVVYDPFMGRGTTPIEAALRGRIPYGNDANPLSRAFTEPRINPPDLRSVQIRLNEIAWDAFKDFEHEELLTFYHPKTLAQIEGLRGWLLAREKTGAFDKADGWIRMVALNRLTGHSPGFFSVYTMPPNQAVSVKSQVKINQKRNQTPPFRDVSAIIAKKSKTLLSAGAPEMSESRFFTSPSDATPEILDKSVALTVTSPPFLDIVNYEADNWLRCWFLGVDPKAADIAQHRSVAAWEKFIRATLVELARVTKPGGHVAFEVGEVRNGSVRLEEHVISAAAGLPFNAIGVIVNQQNFTKTSNCWGVANNKRGTNSNRIVLLKKERNDL